MAQKSSDKRGEKDDTDRSLFARFVEGVVVFCICVAALKFAIEALVSIRIPLIVIAVIVAIIVSISIEKDNCRLCLASRR